MKPFILSVLLICGSKSMLVAQIPSDTAIRESYNILTYGFRIESQELPKAIVGEKWGIIFETVAGCMVTEYLVAFVTEHNEAVYKNLEEKYGKDWKERFDKEVDAEAERLSQADKILKNSDPFKTIIQPTTNFTMEKKQGRIANEYEFKIAGMTVVDEKKEWFTCRLKVNIQTQKVDMIIYQFEKE